MPLSTATDPDRWDNAGAPAALPLAARLGPALDAAGISYCQWKGHGKYARWMAGDGDIDLLVARSSADAFAAVLERLGFKLAVAAPDKQVPGVASYLGLDPVLGRLIHVHAHFRMVLGPAGRNHYHLAIEQAVLASAVQRAHFRTPAPEFELILFVIQQTLRHNPLGRPASAANRQRLQQELQRLLLQVDPSNVVRTLVAHIPDVKPAFFAACLDALRPGTSKPRLLLVRERMRRTLGAHRLGPPALVGATSPAWRASPACSATKPPSGWRAAARSSRCRAPTAPASPPARACCRAGWPASCRPATPTWAGRPARS